MSLCSVTLDGTRVVDANVGGPPKNYFRFRTGASNVGEGRFLMRRSDAAQITASEGGPREVQLVMTDQRGRKISIPVFVRAQFMSSSNISAANLLSAENTPNDIVEVSVYDTRSQIFDPVTQVANAMVQGFPWDDNSSVPYFYVESLNQNGGSPIQWTWITLMQQIGFPAIPNPPAWKPRNLRWRSVAYSRVMDDIAAQLYLIVGFDPSLGQASPQFFAPGSFAAGNQVLLKSATASRDSGGLTTRDQWAPPGVFNVSFAAVSNDASPYAGDAPVSYIHQVTLKAGGAMQAIHVGGYPALYQNTGGMTTPIVNASELNAVAEDLAPRALAFMNNDIAQYALVGLWNFTVDGVIREVTWISDNEGARTLIQLDNNVDWTPQSDEGKTLFPLANQLLTPLGTGGEDVSPGGTRFTWTQRNYFWARITASAPLLETYPPPRYKYSWEEVARGTNAGPKGDDWITVVGGRTGDCSCDFGECGAHVKDRAHFCRYALSMYEGDNLQAAPVSPVENQAIVLMFLDYDLDGYPEYTFVRAAARKTGKITDAGPNGESDYTDERYWVQIEDISTSGISDQLTQTDAAPVQTQTGCAGTTPNIVTATNLAEKTTGTHRVAVDEPILLDGVYDAGGTLHYIFENFPATASGICVTDYYGDLSGDSQIIKFDQNQPSPGLTAPADYSTGATFTAYPVSSVVTSSTVANPCGGPDAVQADVEQFVYVDPATMTPIVKHNGSTVGSGQFSVWDFLAGIVPVDMTTYVTFEWSGFLALESDGSTPIGSGSLDTGGGFTTFEVGAGLIGIDHGGGVLGVSVAMGVYEYDQTTLIGYASAFCESNTIAYSNPAFTGGELQPFVFLSGGGPGYLMEYVGGNDAAGVIVAASTGPGPSVDTIPVPLSMDIYGNMLDAGYPTFLTSPDIWFQVLGPSGWIFAIPAYFIST